jgi:hypothetical protein
MTKFVPYILPTCLIISFIATEHSLSQTEQQENKIDSKVAKPDSTSSYVTGLTSGRAKSLGVVEGLISVIIGWRKARPIGGSKRSGRSRSRNEKTDKTGFRFLAFWHKCLNKYSITIKKIQCRTPY